jgi:ribonuclease inhibitor
MRTINIDCHGAKSAAEVWQRYVDAAAPDGAAMFGRNLDAFWDAIEHSGPGWPRDAKLVFEHSVELAAIQSASGSSLLDELRIIANEATQTQIELA